jgi:hypothetical protein
MIDPKKYSIGQGEILPEELWILIDKDNGHPGSHRYCWWFKTKAAALSHKRWQLKSKHHASLTEPFKYVLAEVTK